MAASVKHQVMGHPQQSLDSLDFAMKREAKREAKSKEGKGEANGS